jgi:GT2 family glycosyltransferase
MNRLLARSRARWFFALNSDAWPDPGAIGRLVDTARSSPRAAAIAPLLLRPDGELEHSTHPFPSLRVAAAMALGGPRVLGQRRAREWLVEGAWLHDDRRTVDWAVGAALLMRRDALDAIGGFDERFFMYAEDLEWCWRAHNAGWTIVFDPDAVVRHVGNASGRQNYASRRTRAYLANTYRFYRGEHGVAATTAYRALNLLGALRMYGLARATGKRDVAAYWRSQLGVHLARTDGVDGPPAAVA